MEISFNSFSNTLGGKIAIDLLSACFTMLKNARPLSETGSQSVTSLIQIKPEDVKSTYLTPLLIAAGAATLIAVAFAVATKVFSDHFSPQKPPSPPQQSPDLRGAGYGSPISTSTPGVTNGSHPPTDEPKDSKISPSRPSSAPPRSPATESPVPSAVPSGVGAVIQKLRSNFSYLFSRGRNPAKFMKYRLIQSQLLALADKKSMVLYSPQSGDSKTASPIITAWNGLINVLRIPALVEVDDEYKTTIDRLREIRQAYTQLEASNEMPFIEKFRTQLEWAREISYQHFVVELFPYCEKLITLVTGPLPTNLNMDAFLAILNDRMEKLNKRDSEHGMNPLSKQGRRFEGTANVKLDRLRTTVSYQDGRLQANGKSILVLWHGTPVQQNDKFGLALGLLNKARKGLAYMIPSSVKALMPEIPGAIKDALPAANPPTIAADYVAFIEEAEKRRENILHVILEDGQERDIGDESARVIVRLKLGHYHDNFFTLSLSMNGDFFKRRYTGEEAVSTVISKFKERLLKPIQEEQDLSSSVRYAEHAQECLSKTGYYVPQKLRAACQLEHHFDALLEEVKNIYFPEIEKISDPHAHQAFLLLSYAHLILFICWKIDIKILGALCKDDKDRGNVVKTILKLHFLYLTGQLNPKTLHYVLVHALARPFICQKNGITKEGLEYLNAAIPWIQKAFQKTPAPRTVVFGDGVIHGASYTVAQPDDQMIFPDNQSAKTMEEYQALLGEAAKQPQTALYDGNLIEELAQTCYRDGQPNVAVVQQRIAETKTKMTVMIGDRALNGGDSYASLLTFLRECGLETAEAIKVSCAIHEELFAKFRASLKEDFENRFLGINLMEESPTLSVIKKDGGGVQLKLETSFQLVQESEKNLGRIQALMTIPDHRTGKAHFECSLTVSKA